MYLRFIVGDRDNDSGQQSGVFQALYKLRDSGKLHAHEEDVVEELRQWFNKNLEVPDRFTAAKPPYYRKKKRAISWFKDTAHEHMSRIREMVAILENHDVAVRMMTSDRVGYVVYEDDYQIVAEPFSDSLRQGAPPFRFSGGWGGWSENQNLHPALARKGRALLPKIILRRKLISPPAPP